MNSFRNCALAIGIHLTLGAAVGWSQTVIVRTGPPGGQVGVLFNSRSAGTATADNNGDATVITNIFGANDRTEKTVQLFVDVCGNVRQVLITESTPPAESGGCIRHAVSGYFGLRPVTSFVIDVDQSDPRVRIWQGRAPEEWLRRGPEPVRVRREAPIGLVLFGGGPGLQINNFSAISCGNSTTCNGGGFAAAYSVGAEIWLARIVSIEGSFLKPIQTSVTGSGNTYHFSSTMNTRIVTLAGKVGIPVGIVRIYGLVGGNYHQMSSSTTNVIDDTVLVLNGETQTASGGTQTFKSESSGFGWLFGGGTEVWLTPSLALYGQIGRTALRGTDASGGADQFNDIGTFELFGARFRVGPR